MTVIKEISTGTGGWFKPAEHLSTAAILIELKGVEMGRTGGSFGPKDSAICDMAIFATQASIDSGTPEVKKDIRVEQTYMAKDLIEKVGIGNATIVVVHQTPPKNGNGNGSWVWRQATDAARAAVVAYVEKREAAKQAAIDSAPGFDD